MGNGVCSRKQKKIFQSLLLVTVVFGMIYGGMFSYEMHKQLKRTEEMAVKYQQHQESLSAQLQDYLLYKIEAQQSLNKEKQDSGVRFNSLHSQHQILKNQHDELKKQYYELQEQHQLQEDEHNKALDEHKQRLDQLHQTKESEISKLKENIFNLHEENKQLRKAHQEVYVQLQDTRQQHKNLKSTHDQLVLTLEDHKSALAAAQVQVDEYKQLKETLNKMPSLRHESAQLVQNRNAEEPHQPQDAQPEAEKHDEVQKPQSQHREEEGEMGGAEERRRELAEEEMEQAGQPQKLEEEKKAQYENVDADIVQGEEEPQTAEEKEVNVHHEEARQNEADHVHREDERPVEVEVDPENDPNNQGEDEFEEAEHQQPHEEEEEEEEVAPVGHPDMHLAVENQHLPPAEDQLVMDGNPDQQEDALDEQYQEDGDDEVG
ncbi:hypothetical protein cypCar_00039882 [Cyprinus carpio]|nr:hypothetical protein cypCar_00039882 [Cyprinus carpio]